MINNSCKLAITVHTFSQCFQKLSEEYPNVVFLKVDVEECEDVCSEYQISAMPTFVFVKNNEKVSLVAIIAFVIVLCGTKDDCVSVLSAGGLLYRGKL